MQLLHGAAAVVLKGDQVLLVQRANPPDAGMWAYPGGHMEHGETAETTAIRELLEETGVIAHPLGRLTVLHLDRFRLEMIACQWRCGTPRAADDALDARWVACDKVHAGALPLSRNVDTVLAMRQALQNQ